MNKKIQGVAFDLDDTLFSRASAFKNLLMTWNPNLTPSSLTSIIERDQQGYSDRKTFFRWLADFLGSQKTGTELHQKFISELPLQIPTQHSHLELLKTLKNRGYKIAILTNGGSSLQREKLKATGFLNDISESHLVISGETPFDKPNPKIFQFLSEKINIPKQNILYVGDHFKNDISGSQIAGLQSAWVCLGRTPPKNFPSKVLVIDQLDELLNHLP